MDKININLLKQIINEELTHSDVRRITNSEIDDYLKSKEFEKNYQDEIENSISNFLIAIWYTLHYNEDLHLKNDELASFMEDLYVSVDLFRKGEYKPDDYKQQMEDDGIKFTPCDYTKIYREKEGKYQRANEETKQLIEEWMANSKQPSVNLGDLQMIIDRLEVD